VSGVEKLIWLRAKLWPNLASSRNSLIQEVVYTQMSKTVEPYNSQQKLYHIKEDQGTVSNKLQYNQ